MKKEIEVVENTDVPIKLTRHAMEQAESSGGHLCSPLIFQEILHSPDDIEIQADARNVFRKDDVKISQKGKLLSFRMVVSVGPYYPAIVTAYFET